MKGISTLAVALLVASFVALPTLRAEQSGPQAKHKKLKSALSTTTTNFAVVGADGTLDHGSSDVISSHHISTGEYSVLFIDGVDRSKCAYAATSLNQTGFNPVTMTITFVDLSGPPGEIDVFAADNSKQPIDTAFSLIVVCPTPT
jgi:hypothetical protein